MKSLSLSDIKGMRVQGVELELMTTNGVVSVADLPIGAAREIRTIEGYQTPVTSSTVIQLGIDANSKINKSIGEFLTTVIA